MDQGLLATKGIAPSAVDPGFVDGYALRIGERATLVRCPGCRAYGLMMNVARSEAAMLYAEGSLTDYLPEPVVVELMNGTRFAATCYNLPGDKITGTNKEYAEALLEVATRFDFPDSYLDQIRQARTQ